MNVYIAAPLSQAEAASRLARDLEADGYRVVSRWHDAVLRDGVTTDPQNEADRRAALRENKRDLWRAHITVVLAHRGTPRATFAEVGYLLGIDLAARIVWTHGPNGEGRCLFDSDPAVVRVCIDLADDDLSVVVETVRQIAMMT